MKAVIYARVSSKEQEETGYSLPSQEKLLRKYGENRGFEITYAFAVSESASGKQHRKVFDQMLQYTKKNNIKILICEKVDRLTRNFKDLVMMDEWLEKDEERQIHLVKDSLILHKNSRSQEKLNMGIRALFAKNQIDNLSEEVKKGQKEKIAQGWLPTKPPLGYRTIGDKGHKIHAINEGRAPLVKRMFELYASGNYSLRKLAQTMYEEGLRNGNGNRIVKSRIATLLSNPFYYGVNEWNGQNTPGRQEPLISRELFDKVQSVLHGKATPKYSKHLYLFKGSMKCTGCVGTITWEKQKGITYGHCNHYRNCSQQTWVKEPEVESQLFPAFSNLQVKSPRLTEWIRKALKESHRDEIEYRTSTVSELQGQLERIQRRLDRLYDDKLDERIDTALYDRKFKEYTSEKEHIESAIQKHSQADTQYFELGMSIYELSQRAPEIYQKAALEEKRQLIKLVFENIMLNEGKLLFTYSKPFEILAGAVQATNSSKVAILEKKRPEIFEPPFSNQNGPKLGQIDKLLPG